MPISVCLCQIKEIVINERSIFSDDILDHLNVLKCSHKNLLPVSSSMKGNVVHCWASVSELYRITSIGVFTHYLVNITHFHLTN